MLAQNLPRREEEAMESWCRRKSRSAGDLARRSGLWSARHAARVSDWQEHISRSRNCHNASAIVYKHEDQAWRRQRRLEQGSVSADAGRLGSRVLTHVHPRWQDSVPSS